MVRSKWLDMSRLRAYYDERNLTGLVHKLVGGISAGIAGIVLANVLGAVAQTLIVRQLGPALYGEYSTIIASLGLLASLLGIGLDTWVLAEGSRHPESLVRNVWSVLLLKGLGAVAALALLALAWSTHIVTTLPLVVGVLWIIVDSFTQTGYSAMRALRRNARVAVFQTTTPLLLLLALWLVPQRIGVLPLLLVQAGVSAVVTVVMLVNIWRLCGSPHEHRLTPWHVMIGAWLFIAADILAAVYAQAGMVILGAAVGPAEAGIFRPALNIVNYTFLLSGLLFSVGLPMLNTPGITRPAFFSLLRLMALGAALYGLAALAGLWQFGHLAILRMYGDEYAASLPLLHTMAVIPLIKAGTFVCAAVLIARGALRLRIALQIPVALLSLLGGWALIPRAGATGAAWLAVAIEASLLALYWAGAVYAFRRNPL